MTPSRPYLIRGLYEWIADNGKTPYLIVGTIDGNAVVPEEYIKDGKIVLDISYSAVKNLVIGNDAMEFKARFGGRIFDVYVPIANIIAIYAKENGEGMMFAPESFATTPRSTGLKSSRTKKPYLKLVE